MSKLKVLLFLFLFSCSYKIDLNYELAKKHLIVSTKRAV